MHNIHALDVVSPPLNEELAYLVEENMIAVILLLILQMLAVSVAVIVLVIRQKHRREMEQRKQSGQEFEPPVWEEKK